MRRCVSIRQLSRLGRTWSHLLTVTLTACLFMNTPGLVTSTAEDESREVLALQSLVADMVNPAFAPKHQGCTDSSVLDVQRLLGESSGANRKSAPVAAGDTWILAPALHREYLSAPDYVTMARAIQIPGPSEAGLRQRVACFAPPPLSRAVERYRMRLTPHAPPSALDSH